MPQAPCCLASPSRSLESGVARTACGGHGETGTYEFSGLPIGVYTVKFELAGFATLVREGLQLQSGFNAQVNGELTVGALQENVVVTGVNPIVDVRSTTQGTRFNVEELQAIPSARDVFQVLTQTPGIAGDRQNVGGTHNGQQTGMFSRGAANGQGRWFVDGVDRNDLANGRPFVIDFNSVEEVQVSTGGADVTMQTPGVFVSVVTKSGSDAFHGASWFFRTDRHLGSTNVTDELRAQGANSGNPLVYTNDYGGQLGGPIKTRPGVVLGHLRDAERAAGCPERLQDTPPSARRCRRIRWAIPSRGHRLPDAEQAGRAGARVASSTSARSPGNLFTVANSFGQRVESIRSADDLHPTFETTNKMAYMVKSDSTYDLGPAWWNTEIWDPELEVRRSAHVQRPLAGRRVLRPPLLVQLDRSADAGASAAAADAGADDRHLGTIVVGFDNHAGHEQHGRRQQQLLPPGTSGAAITRSRPATNTATMARSTTAPTAGTPRRSSTVARPLPIFSTPFTARVIRDFITPAFLDQHSLYLQDTYSRKRVTAIVGLRLGPAGRLRRCGQHCRARLSGAADDRRDAVQPVSRARRSGGPRRRGLEHRGSARGRSPTISPAMPRTSSRARTRSISISDSADSSRGRSIQPARPGSTWAGPISTATRSCRPTRSTRA